MAKAVDKAYQTVRERIVRGVYPASSRITEQEVAAVAGVSRTPVREALRKLHAEGLLEFIPHQGAVVTEWTARIGRTCSSCVRCSNPMALREPHDA